MGDWIATAIFVSIVLLLVVNRVKSVRREREQQRLAGAAAAQRAEEEIKLYSPDDPERLPHLTSAVGGVILKPQERCCAISENVQEIVLRKHTKYVGGSSGVSFRVPGMPKSLSPRVHVGRYRGHAESSTVPEVNDNGNLYITNLRVIFTGAKEVLAIPLAKVADMRADGDMLELLQENRVKPHLFLLTDKRAAVIRAATMRMITEANVLPGPKQTIRT